MIGMEMCLYKCVYLNVLSRLWLRYPNLLEKKDYFLIQKKIKNKCFEEIFKKGFFISWSSILLLSKVLWISKLCAKKKLKKPCLFKLTVSINLIIFRPSKFIRKIRKLIFTLLLFVRNLYCSVITHFS
jgi:hypothetical protein